TARTIVRVDVIAAGAFDTNEAASRLIDSATEAELASSFEVASRAAAALADGTTTREIRDSTSVSTLSDTTVMDLRYTAPTADAARRGADAVASAYLDYRSDEATGRIAAQLDAIDARRTGLREELATLVEEMATF